ncbi:hypothetical protein GOL91_03595 [Sinorhizobium medicae]|nr:hypothetical protein [Sinorhizobium medicae]
MRRTTISRQEVYDLVWSEPVSSLGVKFGISDVAFAKTCRKNDIPLPPRGYWAKLQAGKKASKERLRPRGLGMPEFVQFGGDRWSYYSQPKNLAEVDLPPPPRFGESVDALLSRIRVLVGNVPVPKTLSKAHRMVRRLLEQDNIRRQKYLASTYRSSFDAPLFGSPFEQRRLRLYSAIFNALERQGMQPHGSGKDPQSFSIRVGEQSVSLIIDNPKIMRHGWRNTDDLRRLASEKLVVSVKTGYKIDKIRLSWEDGGDRKVEDFATEIVVAIIGAGELQYRKGEIFRHEWLVQRKAELIEEATKQLEEEERRERERQIQAEQARIDHLLSDAKAFRQAADIRAYIESVRQASAGAQDSISADELEDWASWALAQADRIDPVLSKRFLKRPS